MKSGEGRALLVTVLYVLAVAAAAIGIDETRRAKDISADSLKARPAGCIPTGDAYLRARLRGDSDLDLNWSDTQMQCDGDPRPDGSGVRVTFVGRAPAGVIRLVFGVAADPKTVSARNVPTNVTVIFEDQQKLYSTAGDGKCTIDELKQRSNPAEGIGRWLRVEARGYCTGPATIITGSDSLLMDRFDFAGIVHEETH
jgi:hypothetical protein